MTSRGFVPMTFAKAVTQSFGSVEPTLSCAKSSYHSRKKFFCLVANLSPSPSAELLHSGLSDVFVYGVVYVVPSSFAAGISSRVSRVRDRLEGRSSWSSEFDWSSMGLSRDLLPGDAIVDAACMKVFFCE